jgi:hypothetical protein
LTHDILIGGDINEDLTKKSNDYRANYINQFINECHLEIKFAGNTFVNSAGQPCCEIDYFLYRKSSNRNFSRKFIMDDLAVDVSAIEKISFKVKFVQYLFLSIILSSHQVIACCYNPF